MRNAAPVCFPSTHYLRNVLMQESHLRRALVLVAWGLAIPLATVLTSSCRAQRQETASVITGSEALRLLLRQQDLESGGLTHEEEQEWAEIRSDLIGVLLAWRHEGNKRKASADELRTIRRDLAANGDTVPVNSLIWILPGNRALLFFPTDGGTLDRECLLVSSGGKWVLIADFVLK